MTRKDYRVNESSPEETCFLEFCADWVHTAHKNAFRPVEAYEELTARAQSKRITEDRSYKSFEVKSGQARRLLTCCHTHQLNLKKYFQFLKDCQKCENDASEVSSLVDKAVDGNQKRYRTLFRDTSQQLVTAFDEWSNRIASVRSYSKHSSPLKKRIIPLISPVEVESLVDFKIDDIEVRQGDRMLLLDNEDNFNWLVRTQDRVDIKVPSLFVVICGPDHILQKRVKRMEQDFLEVITKFLRYLGNENGFRHIVQKLNEISKQTQDDTSDTTEKSAGKTSRSRTDPNNNRRKRKRYIKRTILMTTKFTEEVENEQIDNIMPEYSEYSGDVVEKFVISSVMDTKSDSMVSLDDALSDGILDLDNGFYVDTASNEKLVIPEAMEKGYILVERKVVKKHKEKERKIRAGSSTDSLDNIV